MILSQPGCVFRDGDQRLKKPALIDPLPKANLAPGTKIAPCLNKEKKAAHVPVFES